MRATKCFAGSLLLMAFTSARGSAVWCGVNQDAGAQRVFAKVNDHGVWREYRNMPAVPEIEDGSSAQVWSGPNDSQVVRIVEPGEDFWTFTDYCSTKAGVFTRIRFELRTGWGWGYRLEAGIEDSAIKNKSESFFDTETGKPIARPAQADDIREAMRPTIYSELSHLPFAKLLNGRPPRRDPHAR